MQGMQFHVKTAQGSPALLEGVCENELEKGLLQASERAVQRMMNYGKLSKS
jgi:hypothetical protein